MRTGGKGMASAEIARGKVTKGGKSTSLELRDVVLTGV